MKSLIFWGVLVILNAIFLVSTKGTINWFSLFGMIFSLVILIIKYIKS